MTTKYRTTVLRDGAPIRYTIEQSDLEDAVDTFVEQVKRVIMNRSWGNMAVHLDRSDGFASQVIQTFVLD